MQIGSSDQSSRGIQIKELAELYRFSRREIDVFALLTHGTTTISAISTILGLSPNTVSNHLKSLLAKTGASNKAELLAIFLNRTLDRVDAVEFYCQRPSVLVLESIPAALSGTVATLLHSGFRVECRSQNHPGNPVGYDLLVVDDDLWGAAALAHLAAGPGTRVPPILVLSRKLAEEESRRQSEQHGAESHAAQGHPADSSFQLKRSPFEMVDQVPSLGADRKLEYLAMGAEPKHLIFMALYLTMDDVRRKSRMERVSASLQAKIDGGQYAITNIGFGGAFVAVSKEDQVLNRGFRVGRRFDISVGLEDATAIDGAVEVSWVRKKDSHRDVAGIGVQFTKISGPSLFALKRFVLDHREVQPYPF